MNTPVESKLAIKISLADDIRRVSVDPTNFGFEALKVTVKRLFKTLTEEEVKTLTIRYQDDESDWITVSSDEELREAISLLKSENVLRLTLSFPQSKPAPSHCERRRKCGREQSCKQGGEEPQAHPGWRRWCGGRARFFHLHREAIALMEKGSKSDLEAARALFFEQLRMRGDCPTPLYNVACCEALLGNTKPALEYLQKAIAAGFLDVNHIENDEDLKSLRNLDEFKAMVSAIRRPVEVSVPLTPFLEKINQVVPMPASAPAPAPAKAPAPAPAPAPAKASAPAPAKAPSPKPVDLKAAAGLSVLESMGFADKARNEDALKRANYDIPTAVQIIISEAFY